LKDRFTQKGDIAGAVHVTELRHSILLSMIVRLGGFQMRVALGKQTAWQCRRSVAICPGLPQSTQRLASTSRQRP